MKYQLAIGNRSHSSWSLRAWLAFAKFGIPVEITWLPLYDPSFARGLASFAPARSVPAMRTPENVVVFDTFAIAETLAERFPEGGLWPGDPAQRGLARSLAAEMHSSFAALREACPMNLRRAYRGFQPSQPVLADLARIDALWEAAPGGSDGWLFETYSLADVFFAPVATRIATYGLPVGARARSYVEAHLADLQFRRWRALGFAEAPGIASYDLDLPEGPWPGPAPLAARALSSGEPINAECPFSGQPVSPGCLAEIGGQVIGFCNPVCRDKVVADPAAWPEAMALLARG